MRSFKNYNILIISILTLLNLFITSDRLAAQVFDSEQNPLSVKWRQINQSGFTLIYPTELETEAQRMANTIPAIFPYVGASLGIRKTSLPIVFQNRGVVANGFVQLAPKKSEFFATPPQSFDSQDWLNNLAVHEMRHVAQFDKLTGGRAHPFPEEVYYAWFGVSLPLWFFEGDAVSTETSLTHSGRGRQPSWIMPYRAALLSGRNYSYSKASFGSDKDIETGYYQLGYLMISALREKAGKFIVDSLLTDIKKRPLRLYPLSGSMRRFTGKSSQEWFRTTTEKMKSAWEIQAAMTPSENYPALNKPARFETNYHLPFRLPDGWTLVLKSSKQDAPALVMIGRDKSEHRIKRIGQQEQPWFSYAAGKIVWDEVRYDPRFLRRNYSVICSYDLASGKMSRLSSRSRIFSPSLSVDGSMIAAVNIDLSNQVRLIVMDAKTGKILRTISNPDNLMIQTPSFSPDGMTIAYVSVTEAGKALWTVDLNGNTRKLIAETRQQLSRPVYVGNHIAFNAHYNGVDNIYDIDTVFRKISALSASKYGAFNPSVIRGTDSIVFNNFNVNGYDIVQAPVRPRDPGKDHFVFFGAAAEKQENTGNVFDQLPDSIFQSAPFQRLGKMISFHSVVPVIDDEYKGGLQFRSNNLLNTVDAYAGVDYHRDLNRFEYNAGISFKSLFPIFDLSFSNRPRRTFYNTTTGITRGDFRENYLQLQARVPVSLSSANHFFNFSFRAGTSITRRYAAENMPENYITTLLLPLETGFTFSHSIRSSVRDIAPAWAQVLRLTYLSQPFDQRLSGNLFAAESFFYFPGIIKNHTFLANFNFQESNGIRIYTNAINTVYGYANIQAKSRLKNTLLLNYRFPILFPDAELGPLAYIRNIKGGIFCHYENLGPDTNLAAPKTYGFEIHTNMNILRYSPLLDVGTRFVFVNAQYHQHPVFELNLNYIF